MVVCGEGFGEEADGEEPAPHFGDVDTGFLEAVEFGADHGGGGDLSCGVQSDADDGVAA